VGPLSKRVRFQQGTFLETSPMGQRVGRSSFKKKFLGGRWVLFQKEFDFSKEIFLKHAPWDSG
jgi:hypothetical protein